MNIHRLKRANVDRVIKKLHDQGIPASIADAPYSHIAATHWLPLAGDPNFDPDWDLNRYLTADVAGMVGIVTPLSGNQFHKVLVDMGIV